MQWTNRKSGSIIDLCHCPKWSRIGTGKIPDATLRNMRPITGHPQPRSPDPMLSCGYICRRYPESAPSGYPCPIRGKADSDSRRRSKRPLQRSRDSDSRPGSLTPGGPLLCSPKLYPKPFEECPDPIICALRSGPENLRALLDRAKPIGSSAARDDADRIFATSPSS